MFDTVIVLASGWSCIKYRLTGLENRGLLIGVNGAALHSKPHIALTMDRLAAEHCYPIWCGQGHIREIWLRDSILKNFNARPPKATPVGLPYTYLFHNSPGDPSYMCPDRLNLNGENSGVCALNYAYQLEPKRVFLLGFDMQRGPEGQPYWHGANPWNADGGSHNARLKRWATHFPDIAQQFAKRRIEVFNVNHRSLIDAFPVIDYKKFKEMTHT
jgi:hypothetical protein